MRRRPFAIKLQFSPRDTALLRVNKQVYAEAAGIFYCENTFGVPEALFVGPPIMQQVERLYRVSRSRLRLRGLRRLVFDVAVSWPWSLLLFLDGGEPRH